MKIHTSDKAIAWLTLLSGLTISAVAIYYSVAGLTAIFAAAVIPIIVMGVALEISKLAATVWLKQNWNRAPNFIRGYLLAAIAILMVITSMGIFGFLSKAHSDQSLISGDVQSKIAVYDEKIKTAKDNIEAARKALRQMDEAVDQTMARSTSEEGATKASNLRRSQQRERSTLTKEIEANQKIIAALSEESAPIRAEVRKVEAEVGPIKYIAALIYGDNPDANVLEKAVTWVIIIIVIVFDPLAVILLLASQYSFMWFRKQDEESTEGDSPEKESDVVSTATVTEKQEPSISEPEVDVEEVNAMLAEIPKEEPTLESVGIEPEVPKYTVEDADDEVPPAEPEPTFNEAYPLSDWAEEQDQEILESAPHTEKEAMARWKAENPDDSLKHQRRLFERGMITELPWLKYLKPQADFTDDEAAIEAAKWAKEQLEKKEVLDERPGDYLPENYVQNQEQTNSTIWQRLKKSKND